MFHNYLAPAGPAAVPEGLIAKGAKVGSVSMLSQPCQNSTYQKANWHWLYHLSL
jgi:hypothetical protein